MSIPEDKAAELGATIVAERGINWTWSHGFPTREAANEFVKYLDSLGFEHRGVYPNEDGTCSVRWR